VNLLVHPLIASRRRLGVAMAVRGGKRSVGRALPPPFVRRSGPVHVAMRALAAASAATAALVMWGGAPASAETTHQFLFSIDGSQTPAGSFGPIGQGGVVVDNSSSVSSGDVYIADSSHKVVDKMSPSGSYLCQITGAGSASTSSSECDTAGGSVPGASFGPEGGQDAIDASGDLYHVDTVGGVVDEFDPSGKYLSQITLPADAAPVAVAVAPSGDVLIADAGNSVVYQFDPPTSTLTTFATGIPAGSFANVAGVAVDDAPSSPAFGDVYVGAFVPGSGWAADVFSSSGTYLSQVTGTPSGSFTDDIRDVATDPGDGDLYVVACVTSCPNSVSQFDPTGAFLTQLQLPSGTDAAGVAVSAANGGVYVSALTPEGVVDAYGPTEVLPDVTTGSPTKMTPTSATLAGKVNPDGTTITDCDFEYVDDADYNPAAPNPYAAGETAPCASIPSGSGVVGVSAEVAGLTPGATYHVQLVAANTSGSSQGGDVTFITPPPPSIDAARATDLTSTTAQLSVQIDPNGKETSYHFEYGPTTSYGTSVPVPDADIGSGTSDVSVSQQITGLVENTEYHWRVVAANANGTTTSTDHTFIYDTTAQASPDGRAYEMVTPDDKDGASIGVAFLETPPSVAADGSRLILLSIQCFAGAGSCTANRGANGEPFEFTRTSSGWVTTPLAPPASEFPNDSTLEAFDADTGGAWFGIPTPGPEDDWYLRGEDGSFANIGPVSPPADGSAGPDYQALPAAATPDFSEVVWNPNVGYWPFDHTQLGSSVYVYSGTGNTKPVLVGVNGPGPGATDLISECGTLLGQGTHDYVGALSQDGSKVFFTAVAAEGSCQAGPAESQLYARVDPTLPDANTVLISGRSPSDCGAGSGCATSQASGASFEGASADGSKVFFTSTEQLTDDASEDANDQASPSGCASVTEGSGCNLYMYDFDQPSGHNLVDVSAGDTSGLGPRVQGVTAVSADGSHVYFVARGVLTNAANGQGRLPKAGQYNLYMYVRDSANPAGRLAYIATLTDGDALDDGIGDGNDTLANVTPDGRFLVFLSENDLTGDDTSGAGAAQLFRYDAETGQLLRISVGERGFDDNGNDSTATCPSGSPCPLDAAIVAGESTGILGRRDPTMSDDGSRVFFQSPIGLTPDALNHVVIGTSGAGEPEYAQNVYEWEQAGVGSCPTDRTAGCVYLISDGSDASVSALCASLSPRTASGVCLLGSDSTGDNVFFTSFDQLAPQDTDGGQENIWDARVGGGFPYTPTPGPCSGDTCQGSPAPPPATPVAATVTFTGPGNPRSPTASVTVRVVHRSFNGTRFLFRIKVPAAGRITASGARVRAVSRTVRRAGTYTLTLDLNAIAQRRLKRRRPLTVRVRIRYASATGTSSVATVSIKVGPR
jgi:hypothetical protein